MSKPPITLVHPSEYEWGIPRRRKRAAYSAIKTIAVFAIAGAITALITYACR